MKTQSAPASTFVEEQDNPLLEIFKHRYDFIYANHPQPGEKPIWFTEDRHPLTDRLIKQGSYLYGVRFGPTTNYALIDIDTGSAYHPKRDPLALNRIQSTLEKTMGIVTSVTCQSSYSQGLHLYLPFDQEFTSWELGIALTCVLENAGFSVSAGQLEVFPNARHFGSDGQLNLFNGHRLPCFKHGFCLLNDELEPIINGDEDTFIRHWKFTQAKNDLTPKKLKKVLKTAYRKTYRISSKAEKFLNDLKVEIEYGWTGAGQTNRLLGRIVMFYFVFGHVLGASEPLEGETLEKKVVEVARQLPGFEEFCNHQHELENRVSEWVSSIENSHYYHYGYDSIPKTDLDKPDKRAERNKQVETDARERINTGVKKLLEENSLPSGITARYDALTAQGISGQTLYKHRDLWHPKHIQTEDAAQVQLDFNAEFCEGPSARGAGAFTKSQSSLLPSVECDSFEHNNSSDQQNNNKTDLECNQPTNQASTPLTPEEKVQTIKDDIRKVLAFEQRRRQNQQTTYNQSDTARIEHSYRARMQQWRDSGDPILSTEAKKWFEHNGET